jgi:hypothetical protein
MWLGARDGLRRFSAASLRGIIDRLRQAEDVYRDRPSMAGPLNAAGTPSASRDDGGCAVQRSGFITTPPIKTMAAAVGGQSCGAL